MWNRLRVKYPLFLSDFNETWSLLTDFRRKLILSFIIIIVIIIIVSCGRTDGHDETNNLFQQFNERA
jgi:hypothetical protein